MWASDVDGFTPSSPQSNDGLKKVVELNGCCREVTGCLKLKWKKGGVYYIKGLVKEGGGGEYLHIGYKRDAPPIMENLVCPCFKFIPETTADKMMCVVNKAGDGTDTVRSLWQACNAMGQGRVEKECAKENQDCKCDGLVRYGYGASDYNSMRGGMNDRWTEARAVSGSIRCNNANFGDPFHGVVKRCLCRPTGKCGKADFDQALAGLPAMTKSVCKDLATKFDTTAAADRCKCMELISSAVAHIFHCKMGDKTTFLDEWKKCPGNAGKTFGPQCSNNNLLIVSEGGKQLEDRGGRINTHPDKGGWQKWALSPAGGGYVFITSHRGRHLADLPAKADGTGMRLALAGASNWKQERFRIVPAQGDCETAFVGNGGGRATGNPRWVANQKIYDLKRSDVQCPKEVSIKNWLGTDTWPDVFKIEQTGKTITVQRQDAFGQGWGMNLRFLCCVGGFGAKAIDDVYLVSSRGNYIRDTGNPVGLSPDLGSGVKWKIATDDGRKPCVAPYKEDTSSKVLQSFKLVKPRKTWAAAAKHCRMMGPGWMLAGIHSAMDQAAVTDLMHDFGVNDVWIGFNDRTVEGAWEWDGGHKGSWTNWAVNEPNDSNGEDCAHLWNGGRNGRWTWNDNQCTNSYSFVCSLQQYTVPMDAAGEPLKKSWDDAKRYCETMAPSGKSGWALATIRNAADNQVVGDLLAGQHGWIGFNDKKTEGKWVWDHTIGVPFVKWQAGEPNNVGGGEGEDCAEMYRGMTWNDNRCSVQRPFVCELTALGDVDLVPVMERNGAVANGWSDGTVANAGPSLGSIHGPFDKDIEEVRQFAQSDTTTADAPLLPSVRSSRASRRAPGTSCVLCLFVACAVWPHILR